jgi:hypothetical protein
MDGFAHGAFNAKRYAISMSDHPIGFRSSLPKASRSSPRASKGPILAEAARLAYNRGTGTHSTSSVGRQGARYLHAIDKGGPTSLIDNRPARHPSLGLGKFAYVDEQNGIRMFRGDLSGP